MANKTLEIRDNSLSSDEAWSQGICCSDLKQRDFDDMTDAVNAEKI